MAKEKEKVYGMISHDKPKNIHSEWDCYGHWSVRLVQENEDGRLRNFSASDGHPFAGLQITAQYHVKSGEVSTVYGSRIEYEDVKVSIFNCKTLCKTLEGIHKKIGKIQDEWGAAPNFETLVCYFLKAVGALGWKMNQSREWSYDKGEFISGRVPDFGGFLRGEMHRYQEEIREKAA